MIADSLDKITLISEITSSTDAFVESELIDLLDQRFAHHLELWSASCSVAHAKSNHSVIIASRIGGELLTNMIALPCPPDCGEKGTIFFEDFSGSGWSPSIAKVYKKLTLLEVEFGLIKK